MLDKSSAYNVLAERMYFLNKSISSYCNFLDFPLLSEAAYILHVIFKPGVSFCKNVTPFCRILAKTSL